MGWELILGWELRMGIWFGFRTPIFLHFIEEDTPRVRVGVRVRVMARVS